MSGEVIQGILDDVKLVADEVGIFSGKVSSALLGNIENQDFDKIMETLEMMEDAGYIPMLGIEEVSFASLKVNVLSCIKNKNRGTSDQSLGIKEKMGTGEEIDIQEKLVTSIHDNTIYIAKGLRKSGLTKISNKLINALYERNYPVLINLIALIGKLDGLFLVSKGLENDIEYLKQLGLPKLGNKKRMNMDKKFGEIPDVMIDVSPVSTRIDSILLSLREHCNQIDYVRPYVGGGDVLPEKVTNDLKTIYTNIETLISWRVDKVKKQFANIDLAEKLLIDVEGYMQDNSGGMVAREIFIDIKDMLKEVLKCMKIEIEIGVLSAVDGSLKYGTSMDSDALT